MYGVVTWKSVPLLPIEIMLLPMWSPFHLEQDFLLGAYHHRAIDGAGGEEAFAMLIFSVGVGAAYIPSINNLLSIVSPKTALKLEPIESSSEDDGIKMEVVAAMSDEEMAIIILRMQDLTGNRIDETLDLNTTTH